jgi:hypothetical protein
MPATATSGTNNRALEATPMRPAERDAAPSRAPDGRDRSRIVAISVAEIANVAALATKASQCGPTASRRAPIAGPTTTPESCTVCSNAFAAPSRISPTNRGSSAIAAGRSAVPAADTTAVSAITTSTGPFQATTAPSASISANRSRSPQISTVRRR